MVARDRFKRATRAAAFGLGLAALAAADARARSGLEQKLSDARRELGASQVEPAWSKRRLGGATPGHRPLPRLYLKA